MNGHLEVLLFEPLREVTIIGIGPHREDASDAERQPRLVNSTTCVESIVGLVREGVRTVVDVEEDGVIFARRVFYSLLDVTDGELRSWIVEGMVREWREARPVPLHDLWDELGNLHNGVGAHRIEGRAEGEPHPETTHEYPARPIWLEVSAA